jgi:hypothetical protein
MVMNAQCSKAVAMKGRVPGEPGFLEGQRQTVWTERKENPDENGS